MSRRAIAWRVLPAALALALLIVGSLRAPGGTGLPCTDAIAGIGTDGAVDGRCAQGLVRTRP